MRRIAVIVVAFALGACETLDTNVNQGALIGAVLGAAAGGAVGYQFGGGLGQALYTAGGTLAGAAAGYGVGQRLNPSDQTVYRNTAVHALTNASDGQVLSWSNPQTGRSGIFRATRSFYGTTGHLCRNYRATVSFEEVFGTASGTSCLAADGRWTPIAEEFG